MYVNNVLAATGPKVIGGTFRMHRVYLIALLLRYLVHTSLAATVEYVFDVDYFWADPDKTGATLIQGINGSVYGPEIRLQRGDRLIVTVHNRCAAESLAIHWHGFEMRQAQEYDGAMHITMCGIEPMSSFVYDFVADEHPGSYQYHEHGDLDHVATRGLFGPLIVDEPPGSPRLSDYSQDVVMFFQEHSSRSPKKDDLYKISRLIRPVSASELGNAVGLVEFNNLLINGKGAFNVFASNANFQIADLAQLTPSAGETWRLRLINAGNLFAMRFRIDGHRFRVIQTDGADVEPYLCDAITMSSGERFDVLVTFDRAPGSYWFRLETLEAARGIHHGQLGVLRYSGTPAVVPFVDYALDMYPRQHRIWESPQLVTLNCIDQESTPSASCLPITVLRKPAHVTDIHVGQADDIIHDFEVSLRGFNPSNFPGHFVRVLDLQSGKNSYGEDQFAGEYVQFMANGVPYAWMNDSHSAKHPNMVEMHVSLGETVRVVIQHQDRAAHPWHLHGHKFAVLAQGYPNYDTSCDVLYCRSEFKHGQNHAKWITRPGSEHGGFPDNMLDPAVAPLKDTVHLAAGGWAVIQFKADNPGWWFFHCHMAIHAHDGMALVLVEAYDDIPARLKNPLQQLNPDYLSSVGFPSCESEILKYQKEGAGTSCSCWADPESKWDDAPRNTYKCSQWYLCADQLRLHPLDPEQPSHVGSRDRAAGRPWRLRMLAVEFCYVLLLFLIKVLYTMEYKDMHKKEIQHMSERRSGWDTTTKRLLKAASLESIRQEGPMESLKKRLSALKRSPASGVLAAPGLPTDSIAIGDKLHHTDSFLDEQHHNSGLSVTNSARASIEENAASKEERSLHEAYELDLKFTACVEQDGNALPPVTCTFPSGSLILMLGLDKVTPMWLKFLALRRQSAGARVVGDLTLGKLSACDWDPRKFRQRVCYLEASFGRPNIFLLEFLHYYSNLCGDSQLFPTAASRTRHRDLVISIFQLGLHLCKKMSDLSHDVQVRARIAIELILPRSVLILEDPLKGMEKVNCERVVRMIKTAAVELKTTIIFSGCQGVSAPVGGLVDYVFWVPVPWSQPIAGTAHNGLLQFLNYVGHPLPETAQLKNVKKFCKLMAKGSSSAHMGAGMDEREGEDIIEWCAELTMLGKLHEDHDSQGSWHRGGAKAAKAKAKAAREGWRKLSRQLCEKNGMIIPEKSEARLEKEFQEEGADRLDDRLMRKITPKVKSKNVVQRHLVGLCKELFSFKGQRNFFRQVYNILWVEFLRGLYDSITVFKFAETIMIGIVAGCVWFQKGSQETLTPLGEMIGLLFFTTALFSVPPIFAALTATKDIVLRISHEYKSGVCNIFACVIGMYLSWIITFCAWAPLWQIIAYTFADLGASVEKMLFMHVILVLNVLTMRSIGLFLALFVPSPPVNVVIGNLFAQGCMLTNGFYTKLPSWFQFITFISVPRYTLKALLKLEFTWRDTFKVHPLRGSAAFGYPTQWVPAELTGTFLTMRERDMIIMQSPEDSSIAEELQFLLCVTISFGLMFGFGLFLTIWTNDGQADEYDVSKWDVDVPWMNNHVDSAPVLSETAGAQCDLNRPGNGSPVSDTADYCTMATI